MKLGLGTAQFGLDYGLTNAAGRVPERDVAAILSEAAQSGVCYIDTAPAYGRAESVLGRLLPRQAPFRIISKTRHFNDDVIDPGVVRADLETSLRAIRRRHVHGLLAHRADDLLGRWGERLWAVMEQMKADGLANRIGVSVYTPDQADALMQRFPLDIIQLPLSLLDQRMSLGGQLERLKARGVEIHARSLLLQGVLLSNPEALPPFLSPLKPRLDALAVAARDCDCGIMDLALAFVRLLGRVDVAVLGVTRRRELRALIAAMQRPIPALHFAPFAVDDINLIDPRAWPQTTAPLKRLA